MRNFRLYTKLTVIALVGLLILGYGIYRTKDLVAGPKLYVDSPQNGSLLKEVSLTVAGRAERSTRVAINDRPIFIDEGGRFEERLLLFYGYNTITIHAEDKFGRGVSKTLQIVYN